MTSKRYLVKSPVKVGGRVYRGSIAELPEALAAPLVERGYLFPAANEPGSDTAKVGEPSNALKADAGVAGGSASSAGDAEGAAPKPPATKVAGKRRAQ